MNSINKIINYIDSVTPKNISKKKKRIIYDELFCHILDRIDYYEEIGYSEEQSTDKAIEDMGTDEGTKKYLHPDSFSPVKDYDFRYYNRRDYVYDNMEELDEDWEKMNIGDSREEIMSNFVTKYGTVYSKLQSENSENFAIYVSGSSERYKDDTRYIIISFTDGKLTRGDMYWQEYNGKEFELNKYVIE